MRKKRTVEENRAIHLVHTNAWRKRNPERAKEIQRKTRKKNRDHINAFQRAWRAKHPERMKARDRKRYLRRRNAVRAKKYGTTVAEIDRLMLLTACESCGASFEAGSGCIDHCHDTMKIRGVLCKPCNLALGVMFEDPQRLLALARYAETCASRRRAPSTSGGQS